VKYVAVCLLVVCGPQFAQGPVFPSPFHPAGDEQLATELADLDGDGILDAVMACDRDGVGVMLGNADGGFGEARFFGSWLDPVDVAITDLDLDGNLDVVTANGNDESVAALLGDGAGGLTVSFSVWVVLDPFDPARPQEIDTGDVDGDGFVDMAFTTSVYEALVWMPGDGTGQFGQYLMLQAPASPQAVLVEDLDGDGIADIAAASGGMDVVSFFPGAPGGPGPAPAQTISVGTDPVDLAAADLDGDGYRDLLTANLGADSVSVLPGGVSGFGAATHFPTDASPRSIAVGDLNGDGFVDVGTTGLSGLSVLLGDGVGGLASPATTPAPGHLVDLAFPDLDGDTNLDAAFLSGSAGVGHLRGDGTGGFGPLPTASDGGAYFGNPAFADVDLDGRADLVITKAAYGANEIRVLLGDGTGAFAGLPPFTIASSPEAPGLGDLDRDGDPDLVVTSWTSQTLTVLLGDGAGGFGSETTYPALSGGVAVEVVDLDLDGHLDVVVANNSDRGISAWLGDGAGGLGGRHGIAPGTFSDVTAADLNGDGIPDLAATMDMHGQVKVLLNTGSGLSYTETLHFAGQSPDSVFAADLDGDGDRDLAIARQSGGDLTLLTNDGLGGFPHSGTDLPVEITPRDVAVGDVDADGAPDLVFATSSLHGIGVMRGDGVGGFSRIVYHASDSGSLAGPRLATADFDGDGRLDVAVVDGGADPNVVLFRNQLGHPTGITSYGVGTPGCLGTMALSANGVPRVGNGSFAVTGANAPREAIGILALTDMPDVAGTLTSFGFLLHVDLNFLLLTAPIFADPSGAAIAPVPIPGDPALAGLSVHAQAVWRWPAAGLCRPTTSRFASTLGSTITIQP